MSILDGFNGSSQAIPNNQPIDTIPLVHDKNHTQPGQERPANESKLSENDIQILEAIKDNPNLLKTLGDYFGKEQKLDGKDKEVLSSVKIEEEMKKSLGAIVQEIGLKTPSDFVSSYIQKDEDGNETFDSYQAITDMYGTTILLTKALVKSMISNNTSTADKLKQYEGILGELGSKTNNFDNFLKTTKEINSIPEKKPVNYNELSFADLYNDDL